MVWSQAAVRPAIALKGSILVTAPRNPLLWHFSNVTSFGSHCLRRSSCKPGKAASGWAWASKEPWKAGRGRSPGGSDWSGATDRYTLAEEPEVASEGSVGSGAPGVRGRGGAARGPAVWHPALGKASPRGLPPGRPAFSLPQPEAAALPPRPFSPL